MNDIRDWIRCKIVGHTWRRMKDKVNKICLDCKTKVPLKPRDETIADIQELNRKGKI